MILENYVLNFDGIWWILAWIYWFKDGIYICSSCGKVFFGGLGKGEILKNLIAIFEDSWLIYIVNQCQSRKFRMKIILAMVN